MKFLAVNFHYIGEEDAYESGIYPVSLARIRRQVEAIKKSFTFVSGRDVLSALRGEHAFPEHACIVTFDDGLKCQIPAFELLDSLEVSPMVFVPTLPLVTGRVLQVHKIHWLLAHVDSEHLYQQTIRAVREKSTDQIDEHTAQQVGARKYRYDLPRVAALKYILNSFVNADIREDVVNHIFAQHVADESSLAAEMYMSADDLSQLGSRDMLGLHSHTHTPLNGGREDIRANLVANKDILDRYSDHVYAVSYPYGSPFDISPELPSIARDLGLSFGFTMERAFNATLQNPFFFARADTNDVFYGKRPCISYDDSGGVRIHEGFSEKRQLLCVE